MSVGFAINSGSFDYLNVQIRCGASCGEDLDK